MTDVIDFYDRHPISELQVLDAVRRRRGALTEAPLTADDLFEFDQDHYGGLAAVDALARLAGIEARTRVLDICAGLGGPARFLAEARIEPAAREWQGGGVGANDPDLPVEPDQPREPGRAHGPAGVQLDGDHAAAAPGGQEAGGPPQAGADVEDTGAGVDAGQAGEGVDGGEAAVVILVELEQVIGGERNLGQRAAAPADCVEHL